MLVLSLAALAVSVGVSAASAAELFVNNRIGADDSDGSIPFVAAEPAGPLKTISRAIALAKPSTVIHIANTGVPYTESLSLVGSRVSGTEYQSFQIRGNGAVVTGAVPLPPEAWQEVGIDLWQIRPWRKGHVQLVRDVQAVSELRRAPGESWTRRPEIPLNNWCFWQGTILLHADHLDNPSEQRYSLAQRDCGLTVYHASHITISDLTFRHFRLDGVNAHDLATDIVLRNVTLEGNGRSGLSVGGTSRVSLVESTVQGNRDFSVLVQELAGVSIDNATLDAEPFIRNPVR